MGAGVLPTTIYNKKLYFLFGKENEYDDTQGWSDFAGGQEEGETPLQTAIREGTEELTGFLGSEKDLRRMLRRYGTYNLDMERYRTQIFPYEYDDKLEHYYNNTHSFIKSRLDPNVLRNSKIFEKEEIRWICVDDLKRCRRMFRPFYRVMVDKIYDSRVEIERFIRGAIMPNGKMKPV